MKPQERSKFIEVLTGVHDFYGKELSDFAGQVWMQACEAFDVEQVTKALSAHLMDADRGQFMPKPADIVRQLQGTKTDRSLMAWGKVLDAMQRVGAYSSVVFDEPAIHAAIEDLGGWPAICRTEMDSLSYLEKRFCDSYKAYVNRGDFTFPGELAGVHALENNVKGYRAQPPMLIGNRTKAHEVRLLGSSKPKTEMTQLIESVPVIKQIGHAA
jgi:hypothetical protein